MLDNKATMLIVTRSMLVSLQVYGFKLANLRWWSDYVLMRPTTMCDMGDTNDKCRAVQLCSAKLQQVTHLAS